MRILFAITRGEVGGAQEHLRILASGYRRRGHHVGLVTETPSSLADALAPTSVEMYDWSDVVRNPNPMRDLRARRQLRQAVEEFDPDVLHLYSSKAGVLGRGILRRPKGITVFTCHHAPYGPRRRWLHRLVGRPMDQLTLPSLDGIISDGARDMPLLRKLAPGVPIRLIRNAVPAPSAPDGGPPNHSALWVARMQDPKDPLVAVAAWPRVVQEFSDARLIMCGTGPLEGRVRAAASRSTASSNIDVLGRVGDLAEYRARCSVYLLATRVEGGITMATLESMANGLVPIVSDAGDAFLIEHARAGLVIQPRSARAVASAAVTLFRNPAALLVMRERALAFAREDWTVEDFTNATLSFYEEVLNR